MRGLCIAVNAVPATLEFNNALSVTPLGIVVQNSRYECPFFSYVLVKIGLTTAALAGLLNRMLRRVVTVHRTEACCGDRGAGAAAG